jgi:hypothetical protein
MCTQLCTLIVYRSEIKPFLFLLGSPVTLRSSIVIKVEKPKKKKSGIQNHSFSMAVA